MLKIAEEIFAYVLRDMTDEKGGFYSAEDADSEGEEGKFYVWTIEEIKKILGDKSGEKFIDIFGFRDRGNFHDEATRQLTGSNIPYLKDKVSNYAKTNILDVGKLKNTIEKK